MKALAATDLLTFIDGGNAKLPSWVWHFSLLSGWTCPGAKECLAKVDKITGKLIDGLQQKVRCFSATAEAAFPTVFLSRKRNTDLLTGKSKLEMVELICASLPKKARVIRVHVAGDFFNQVYFDAWMEVADRYPHIVFYAYTKALDFWCSRLDKIPSNFRLTASLGGRHDELAKKHNLRTAEVVFSEEEALAKNLEIDHDESHAISAEPKSFGLLLHGQQRKGSEASEALKLLRRLGKGGYGKRKS